MKGAAYKPGKYQQGAVLAEMALVTPILVFVLVAIAELAHAFIEHNTLTKAVRSGARYVAANAYEGTTGVVDVDATLINEARNLVVYGSTAPAGGATPILPGLAVTDVSVVQLAGDDIEISASYTSGGLLGPVLPLFYGGGGINTTHNLQATVTMRAL